MSTGLKYISAVIAAGAGPALLRVDDQYMIDDRERSVLEFTRGHYRRYREVPTATIVREHTGVTLPTSQGNLAFHLDNLHDRYQFEILRELWPQFRDKMRDAAPEPVIADLENTVRRLRRTRRQNSLIDAHDAMGLVTDRLTMAMQQGGLSGIPSPWPFLNNQTGGYQPADLISLVGRSGMGKTAMLLAQADAAYDAGYSTLFVTTEMGAEQISRRHIAMRYGLNPENLKKGTVSTYTLRRIQAIRDQMLGRERFRLLALGTGAKLGSIDAAIEECAPDIVYIDGIYLFRPNAGGSNLKQSERVTAVFDDLKQQCIDTNLPHLTTTQFNRQAGKGGKEGSLENIGLSDAIGWHSSIVLAVKPGPTENPLHSRELDFLKGREGEQGSFAINFKFRPVDFSEIPPEELDELVGRQTLNVDADWT